MKSILKSNVKLFYAIVVTSVLLLSLSYGTFLLTSDKYNASELLVGNLLYGITIHDTDKQELTNPVTVPTGETTLYITISSVNSISSKYTLAYDNNNVTVSASNKSGWNASGSMSTYNNYAYSKTVKVVVTNNSGSNQSVTFAAFGGYSYNSTSNIPLGNGYYTVANFIDVTSTTGKLLTTIVEEDTNCNSSNCLYGGEATTNYFTFEEDGDLYRILGTYTIDNDKVAKIAANTLTETSTLSNLSTTLNTIKNSLDTDYIYSTNKFNCTGTTSLTCASSNYTDLGILSLDEYKGLEGDNESSYLYNSNSYYLLNGNTLVSNTSQSETPSTAYVRPTMYLESAITVTGSGTSSDPYIIESQADFNLVAMYLQNDTTSTALSNYTETNSMPSAGYTINTTNTYCTVNGSTDNSASIYTNSSRETVISGLQKGSKCYLYFDLATYTVTGATNNSSYGTVSSSSVSYGGTTTLTITPGEDTADRSGFYLSDFSCDNGYTVSGVNTGSSYTSMQTATISNNNQTNNTTCTATFQATNCTVTRKGSNGFSADYNCVNGTGTMTICRYSGAYGSATCNGGSYGNAATSYCTLSTDGYFTLYNTCNTSLGQNTVSGGGLDKSISCSCE